MAAARAMFSGSSEAHGALVRDAARKASASEPPLTFAGRRGQGMAREVAAWLDAAVAADEARQEAWLEGALALLRAGVSGPQDDTSGAGFALPGPGAEGDAAAASAAEPERAHEHDDDDARSATGARTFDSAKSRGCLTCIFLLLRSALEQRVPAERVRSDLVALRFSDEIAARFARRLGEERAACESGEAASRLGLPRLESLDWRVDAMLASARGAKDAACPLVTLRLALDDGRVRTVQLPIAQFQRLRHATAKVLAHIGELETHPMVKIMQQLEEQQRLKL